MVGDRWSVVGGRLVGWSVGRSSVVGGRLVSGFKKTHQIGQLVAGKKDDNC